MKTSILTIRLLAVSLVFCSLCLGGAAAVHTWVVNDPNSCPLEAEIGEPIIVIGTPPPSAALIIDSVGASPEQERITAGLKGTPVTMGEFFSLVYPGIWNQLSREEQGLYNGAIKNWDEYGHDPLAWPNEFFTVIPLYEDRPLNSGGYSQAAATGIHPFAAGGTGQTLPGTLSPYFAAGSGRGMPASLQTADKVYSSFQRNWPAGRHPSLIPTEKTP